MEYKVGFIGCGNMGYALAEAAAKAIGGENIILSAKEINEAKAKSEKLGAAYGEVLDVLEKSEFIFIAVKPQNLGEITDELKKTLKGHENEKCIVSIVAGVKIEALCEKISKKARIIRIMPNTPVSVGKGMILMSVNENVDEETKNEFKSILTLGGEIDEIPESLIDAGTAISGCGPAYCFMFLDALADGGVLCGIPKEKALKYAIETLIGAATLVKETGETPSALKDKVTSPGGSTIEGVKALEEGAFRAHIISAVKAAMEKTKELGK